MAKACEVEEDFGWTRLAEETFCRDLRVGVVAVAVVAVGNGLRCKAGRSRSLPCSHGFCFHLSPGRERWTECAGDGDEKTNAMGSKTER